MTRKSAMPKRSPTVLVTRPQPDASRFAAAVAARGWTPVVAPLLTIERRDIGVRLEDFAAVAFTSSNGVRAAPSPFGWRGITFCVGPTTAATAAAAGWSSIVAAEGDVDSLARVVADALHSRAVSASVLHLSGADAAGDLVSALTAAGLRAERRVAYAAVAATTLPPEASAFLDSTGECGWASFFSARTAEIFLRLSAGADRRSFERADAAALSAAVADKLSRVRWRKIAVADAPSEEALLDAIARVQTERDAIRP